MPSITRVLLSCLLPVLALTATPVVAAAEDDRIFDLPYLMRDLDNGLRVIIVRTDYPDIVSLQIPVQTGSRNEVEPGKSGFAHFFEHMMFRGTERFPVADYQAVLQNAGADQNAYTTDDYTNYHITFTKADLEQVLEIEADRFMNLSYTEEQFRTEAQAVKGEYLKNYSNPLQKIFEQMRDTAFTVHPYKHTTMGFFEDIEDMPNQLEYSKVFFDRWYRPEKSAVIIVGDVDPVQTFELVKRYWGGWERGSYDVEIPVEPPPQGPIYEHVQWEAPTQPWVVLAFRGPAWNPREKAMPAMDVISQLYLGESSDLYQKLVVQDQVVDQLFPYFPDREDPNLLWVGARLSKPEAAASVRDAILDTLVRARTERVDDQRLEDTKARLKYAFTAGLDNSEGIAEMLASYVRFERTPEVINELYRSYDALTPEDLMAQAELVFNDDGRGLVTLSNAETMPGMAEMLPLEARVSAARATTADAMTELVEMRSDSSPLVDVSLVFKVGAAYDPPGKKGLAALTAAMITNAGSQAHTIQEIEQAMYPMAASFDAQVDKEMTRFSGSVHKDNLADWYRLAMEQLLTPGWRDADFARVKTQTINAIRTDLVGNNDEELGKEALYGFIYGNGHAYGSLNLGAVSDIETMTLEDVRGFYDKHYTQENLTVGLAGGYDERFAARLRQDLTRLPQGRTQSVALARPQRIDGREVMIIEKETPAVAVSFGFPIDVRRGDKDWVALWLARSWLGEHRNSNSHLYKRIREQRGMNYGDYAYIEYFPRGMFQFHPDANLGRQQQIFQVWIRPLRTNNDAHFATRVAMYELEKMIDDGISEEDFEATRNYLDKFVSLLTKTQSRQLGYALDAGYYDTASFSDYVRKGLAKLTVKDVNRAIRDHLQIEDVKFVFIAKDAQDLRDRLVGDAPSPIEYNTPKPELADEDNVIEELPLDFEPGKIRIVPVDEIFM